MLADFVGHKARVGDRAEAASGVQALAFRASSLGGTIWIESEIVPKLTTAWAQKHPNLTTVFEEKLCECATTLISHLDPIGT